MSEEELSLTETDGESEMAKMSAEAFYTKAHTYAHGYETTSEEITVDNNEVEITDSKLDKFFKKLGITTKIGLAMVIVIPISVVVALLAILINWAIHPEKMKQAVDNTAELSSNVVGVVSGTRAITDSVGSAIENLKSNEKGGEMSYVSL